MNRISDNLLISKTDKKLAILIDPDKHDAEGLGDFLKKVLLLKPDIIFLGSSLIANSSIEKAALIIKANCDLPLILFPGNYNQLNNHVDGVMLLSLISGRNPEFLIGQHVLAAPLLSKLDIDVYSTGYMLIDGGCATSVSYISNTQPIPGEKIDIALCTALAGEYIGMKYIYLDTGSGAKKTVSNEMINSIASRINVPLIVGGGIRSKSKIEEIWNAGANLVVVGNALEEGQFV